MYEAMAGIRAITEKSVPVYVWQPAAAAGIMFRFGPEIYGGNGYLSEKIKNIVGSDEKTRNEEAEKVSEPFTELPFFPLTVHAASRRSTIDQKRS